jgi:uncharacterized heparinase superfamily protein
MTEAALRWWHTVRHLRPVQVGGRLWFRLHRPSVDLRPAPPWRPGVQPVASPPLRAPAMLQATTFRFLEETHDLASLRGWDDPAVSKLWRYNLHYFDDLVAQGASARTAWHRALIDRWMRDNPPARGSGWEPYPASLRIVNWLRWRLAGNEPGPEAAQSLATQVRWLRGRLEHHLLGNHLWANAKALVFAGVSFAGPEADAWRATGLRLLRRELQEQVLADGGHFERSPMYHATIVADLLELLALSQALPGVLPPGDVAAWSSALPPMLRWLDLMSHPDGEIALFNDAAFGIAPTLAALQTFADALGVDRGTQSSSTPSSLQDLPVSGYTRLEAGPAIVWADAGPVGPDYIPGHAHADTLSFEMSLHGHRLVVDSGTSRYDLCPERLRQRGTAAHNTLQLDGADSSEVWSSFRVGRRARPFDRRCGGGDAPWLEAAHDGYRRLPGRPVHRRRWQLSTGGLQVTDTVEGRYSNAVARYHFHPEVVLHLDGERAGRLELPGGRSVRWHCAGAVGAAVPSTYHPRFNQTIPNPCLELRLHSARCEFELRWD